MIDHKLEQTRAAGGAVDARCGHAATVSLMLA